MFNFHAANTIILSFLPLYLKYKGLSGKEMGWVLSIGPLASIISQAFWGYLSDKYKTIKTMLLISIAGMLSMSIVFFQMDHLVAILMVGAFFYFFSSPVAALGDSLVQRRAKALNVTCGSKCDVRLILKCLYLDRSKPCTPNTQEKTRSRKSCFTTDSRACFYI